MLVSLNGQCFLKAQSATKSLKPRVSHQGFEKISRNLLYKWTRSNQGRNNSRLLGGFVATLPHPPTRPRLKDNSGRGLVWGRGQRKHGVEGYVWALSFSGVRRRRRSREDLKLQPVK